MKDLRMALLKADVDRANKRKHKRCPDHGDTRIVCRFCARVYCRFCEKKCPRCYSRPHHKQRPMMEEPPSPTAVGHVPERPQEPRLARIHAALLPLHLQSLERHEDSGHWMAVFPFRLSGFSSSEALAEHVLRTVRDWAEPTPFGAGRRFKPDRWFVTFKLRDSGRIPA